MLHPVCPRCGLRHIPTEDGTCPLGGTASAPEPSAPADPEDQPTEAEPTPEAPTPEAPAPEAPTPEAPTPPPSVLPEEPVPALTATPAPPAAPPPVTPPASPPVLADGQSRCPHCGEAVYAGEQVCWNCSKRVEDPIAAAPPLTGAVAPPPTGAGTAARPPLPAPPPPPLPVAPTTMVPPAGPVTAGPEPVKLGWDDAPPADETPPPPEALRLAYWSLGLGLAAILTCGILSIVGPIALWLGIRATREEAGPIGVAGLVLGALATLVFLVVGVAVIIMFAAAASSLPSESLLPDPASLAHVARMLVETVVGTQ